MKKIKPAFIVWLLLLLVTVAIALPDNLIPGRKQLINRNLDIKQGLDLQGGTEVILQADMTDIAASDQTEALTSVEEVIRRRVDLFGVSEPLIQRSISENNHYLIVQLPGIKDIATTLNLIGQTAQLDFREEIIQEGASPATTAAQLLASFKPTTLTGKDLSKIEVQFGGQTGSGPQVSMQFTDTGSKLFADITSRNVGNRVGIFLDGLPLTLPVVQQEITTGQAVITGNFTIEEAKNLSIQLNAGALPIPIQIVKQRTVGATLGSDSVLKSLKAGIVGLSLVMIFMVAYYGKLGLIAGVGLIIYGLITITLYKLIPVTLTLPGLAGFILSVGMAVDANILVFERMKEELRLDKPWQTALELGFGRAWDSIKDANLATLTISFILFNPLNWQFLPQSGLVRGFALTLSLGILISLFTGVVVTRALLRTFYKGK